MAIGRAARREERRARATTAFGRQQADAVLDLLELLELAWHDCYGEITPPEGVVDDVLRCAAGDLTTAVRAARLAVTDPRDLRTWAQAVEESR